ncbi:MAG: hypothetical protein M0C28_48610 [Candidatus Moduliflexus flocculans]|nr:hypothetical protein [Candidatus Moduliflexus flocculans]
MREDLPRRGPGLPGGQAGSGRRLCRLHPMLLLSRDLSGGRDPPGAPPW